MNLDRESLSSDKIQRYKDFNQLKSDVMLLKKPLWKNPWFWGTTGIASTAIIISFGVVTNNKLDKHETVITKHDLSTSNQQKEERTQVIKIPTAENNSEAPTAAADEVLKPKIDLPSENRTAQERVEKVDKPLRTLSFDVLEDEFPALKDVSGQRFEILEKQRFNPQWFEQTWDDIFLKRIDNDHYLLKFSSKVASN